MQARMTYGTNSILHGTVISSEKCFDFEARVSPSSSEVQRLVGVGLRVAANLSEHDLTVLNPVKRLRQAQLATKCLSLCEDLKSGDLQFRLT